jgi:hypothetical protein
MKGRKQFSFEKKKQKTFVMMAYALRQRLRQLAKVSCFFSPEKKCFLSAATYPSDSTDIAFTSAST